MRELTDCQTLKQFSQTFLTNPSRNYQSQIPCEYRPRLRWNWRHYQIWCSIRPNHVAFVWSSRIFGDSHHCETIKNFESVYDIFSIFMDLSNLWHFINQTRSRYSHHIYIYIHWSNSLTITMHAYAVFNSVKLMDEVRSGTGIIKEIVLWPKIINFEDLSA